MEFRCKLPRQTFTVDVALSVPDASIYSLFGPSGAGKSSILNVMAGFEHGYTSAHMVVDGQVLMAKGVRVPSWQRGIVLVEQGARLFPHLTVRENLVYALSRTAEGRLDTWLRSSVEAVGLDTHLDVYPHALSGGLEQRAVLIRAMAVRPKVLLLDEPFTAMDADLRQSLQDIVIRFTRELGTTVILVTHQLAEAGRMAQGMALIDEGHVLQQGSPLEVTQRPSSWRAAQLLGYSHRLAISRESKSFAYHPSRCILGEHRDVGPALKGTVANIYPRGGHLRAEIDVEASLDVEETSWRDSALRTPLGDGALQTPLRLELDLPADATMAIGQYAVWTVVDPPYFE